MKSTKEIEAQAEFLKDGVRRLMMKMDEAPDDYDLSDMQNTISNLAGQILSLEWVLDLELI